MRLLLVGVLLCIGLQLEEVKPVQAIKGDFAPGYYKGPFKLSAKLHTEETGKTKFSKWNADVFTYWTIEGTLILHALTSDDAYLAFYGDKSSVPVEVREEAASNAASAGQDCIMSSTILGKGSFISLPLPELNKDYIRNYNQLGSFFTVPLTWSGIQDWPSVEGRSHGSAPNCGSLWDVDKGDAGKKAIEAVSKKITVVRLQVTKFYPWISGTCDLPTWKGTHNSGTPNGGSIKSWRTVESCTWKVYPVRPSGLFEP